MTHDQIALLQTRTRMVRDEEISAEERRILSIDLFNRDIFSFEQQGHAASVPVVATNTPLADAEMNAGPSPTLSKADEEAVPEEDHIDLGLPESSVPKAGGASDDAANPSTPTSGATAASLAGVLPSAHAVPMAKVPDPAPAARPAPGKSAAQKPPPAKRTRILVLVGVLLAVACLIAVGGVGAWLKARDEQDAREFREKAWNDLKRFKTEREANADLTMIKRARSSVDAAQLHHPTDEGAALLALISVWQHKWHYSSAGGSVGVGIDPTLVAPDNAGAAEADGGEPRMEDTNASFCFW